MKPRITHYPRNVGRKYCALVGNDRRKVTGWGDTPGNAIKTAEEILFTSVKKKGKSKKRQ